MFRVLAAGLLVIVVAGCASISDQEIANMASSAKSVEQLADTVAVISKGQKQSYGKDKFVVRLERKPISADRFRPMLKLTCNKAYRGVLLSEGKNIPLGRKVPTAKLVELSGRDGDIVEYLRAELTQSLAGYVKKENNSIKRMVQRNIRGASSSRAISNAVCVTYRDGIVMIPFSAVLLSDDGIDGSSTMYWGFNKAAAYETSIKRELAKAQTVATRAMWEAKEQVHHYAGESAAEGVALKMKLTAEKDIASVYRMEFWVENSSPEAVQVNADQLLKFTTAAAVDVAAELKSQEVSGPCSWDNGLQVDSSNSCSVTLTVSLPGFDMPYQRMDFEINGSGFELMPVSYFDFRGNQ